MAERYFRTREAADYIGVSFRTMQNYIADGVIPCVKPVGRWIFRQSDLDVWLNNELR